MLTDVDACTETYSESSAKNNPVYSGLPIDFILPGHPSSFWYAVPSGELLGVFSNLPVVHEPADPCVWTEGRASSLARAVFSTIVCVV